MKLHCVVAALALSLGGCSSDKEAEPQPESTQRAQTAPTASTTTTTGKADGCDSDAEGQIACLKSAFELKSCDDAAVLGSAHSSNAENGTYNFRTAYGVKNTCREELEAAVRSRGFRGGGKGQFVSKRDPDYRETVIFGLQTSSDGSVIEWERIQE